MNVLSLFSGIGGLDLGLERAGMTITGQVEIDPWCRRILEKHWPEVPRHDDVRTAVRWWRRSGRRLPDLVCGGFPCQPVSVAGKGLAQADSRWLWPAFASVVRDLRPWYAFVENVPGLLGRGMGEILGDLAAIGYDAEWECIPAASVGAPHLRNRVWIVAYPGRESLRKQPGRGCGTYRPGPSVAGHDGPPRNVADTEGVRGALRASAGERPGGPAGSSDDVADTRRERHRQDPRGLPGDAGGDRAGFGQFPGGSSADVADPDSVRRFWGAGVIRSGRDASLGEEEVHHPRDRREPLADPDRVVHRHGHDGTPAVFPGSPGPDAGGWRGLRNADHWHAEPAVGRVADGVPGRMDRLRGLGNSVVPQVAQYVGELIMEDARCVYS